MGRPALNLVGERYGKLVITRKIGIRGHQLIWEAKCDCGSVVEVNGPNMRTGKTKGCGCLQHQSGPANASYRHGQTLTPEYRAYQSAKSRCENPNVACYSEYGGRGITFGFDSFEDWYSELGPRPTPQHSVDRIDNNGSYESGNVRWSTKSEQTKNRRKFTTLSKYSNSEIFAELRHRGYDIGE